MPTRGACDARRAHYEILPIARPEHIPIAIAINPTGPNTWLTSAEPLRNSVGEHIRVLC